MAKSQQIIILKPSTELVFKGPFDQIIASQLSLTNPTANRVCFKVKTTVPRRYCVRPNSGIIEPNSEVTVSVMLQPFEFDPTEKNKHKFMVQTIIAPEGEFQLETLFKNAVLGQLMDSKLRCVFELPPSDKETNADAPPSTDAEPAASAKVAGVSATEVAPRTPPKVAAAGADRMSADSKLQAAAEDVKLLRSENSALKQELLQLKEEICRLRTASKATPREGAGGESLSLKLNQDNQEYFTPAYAMMAFLLAVVSFILGKFIL